MIVRSFGSVQNLAPTIPTWSSSGSVSLYGGLSSSYGAIYRSQPGVRTVIDFLARNVAQIGLHVYRRLSDTDRERLPDHGLAQTLARPNPATTRYGLFERLVQDIGVYNVAFWLKVRQPDRLGLLRLPPDQMTVEGGLIPSGFVWMPNGREEFFATSEIVYFGGYDPENPVIGLSMLETLRHILAEEEAASQWREYYWANAARVEGVITRPKDAPPWNDAQRQRFREQWQEAHAGASNSGKTGILEDGMTWEKASFSARDSEYTPARKLGREWITAGYHTPLPMVGILDHATFSNIREQHKNLYQDALGPTLTMIEEEIERQLLIEFDDQDRVYTEFNIAEKMKGSFEEQAQSLRTLVGGPIMTQNEARARLNLSSVDDESADQLIKERNVTGSDQDEEQDAEAPPAETSAAAVASVVETTRARQLARLSKHPVSDRPAAFDAERWDRELTADLTPLVGAEHATRLATRLNGDLRRELEGAAMHARVLALEARPDPLTVHVTTTVPPPIPDPKTKIITFDRNHKGELASALMEEVH